jgi:hypothetical protein
VIKFIHCLDLHLRVSDNEIYFLADGNFESRSSGGEFRQDTFRKGEVTMGGGSAQGATSAPHTVFGRDFTADLQLVWLSLLAIPVGLLCAVVARILLRLIGLLTSILYFQQLTISDELISPAGNELGWLAIFVPVVGVLIIGLIAPYGSERIRGYGIRRPSKGSAC